MAQPPLPLLPRSVELHQDDAEFPHTGLEVVVGQVYDIGGPGGVEGYTQQEEGAEEGSRHCVYRRGEPELSAALPDLD